MQKSIKSALKKFEVRFDYDFENFLRICKSAYVNLHRLGVSHSVEVYENGELAGGLYGQIFGKVFCGESMISLKTGASKVALIALCRALEPFDFLIDCQVMNDHLKFMGAKAMKRSEFLSKFNELKNQPGGFSEFKNLP